MHLPTFWCDGESPFYIVKIGENLGTKQGHCDQCGQEKNARLKVELYKIPYQSVQLSFRFIIIIYFYIPTGVEW
jgi:hypothetical protein